MLDDGSLELSWALVQSLESLGQAKLADHMYELAYRRGVINHWSRWLDRVDLHHFSQLVARVAVRQVFNEFLGGPGGCPDFGLSLSYQGRANWPPERTGKVFLALTYSACVLCACNQARHCRYTWTARRRASSS